MPVYELGFACTSTADAAPSLEIMSPTRPAFLLEFAFGTPGGGSTLTWEFHRPSNTPAGGTPINASETTNLEGEGTSSLGVILSGWSTAPTVAAGGMHRISRNPTGTTAPWMAVFGWLPGEMVVGTSRSQSLLLWNTQAPGAGNRVWMRWEE